MREIVRRGVRLRDDSDGITSIEYAIMSGLMVIAIVGGMIVVTSDLGATMAIVAKAITTNQKVN